jgi:hypothetical protein
VRVNVRVLGPFTVAHLISAALMLVGLGLIAAHRPATKSIV